MCSFGNSQHDEWKWNDCRKVTFTLDICTAQKKPNFSARLGWYPFEASFPFFPLFFVFYSFLFSFFMLFIFFFAYFSFFSFFFSFFFFFFFFFFFSSGCVQRRDTTCTMIINVRTAHHRCQAQSVEQDTDSRHTANMVAERC